MFNSDQILVDPYIASFVVAALIHLCASI